MQTIGIGISVPRKESPDKVTGSVKYNTDFISPELLYAWMVTSLYAHAEIKAIDCTEAFKIRGVHAVITGDSCDFLYGPMIEDRPPIARGKVRYFGEPVAVVVADSEEKAKEAAGKVMVEYSPLPVINSPSAAMKEESPLIHERLAFYKHVRPNEIFPRPGTNIAQHIKIRKGDMKTGWGKSEVIVKSQLNLPQSDHIAMEPRNVRAEIEGDGRVVIHTSSQAPFYVQKILSYSFNLDDTKVTVHVPLVGGGFGGKTTAQLEIIAYLASRAVNGRPVKLVESREQDMTSSPCNLGMEAIVKIGSTKDGKYRPLNLPL